MADKLKLLLPEIVEETCYKACYYGPLQYHYKRVDLWQVYRNRNLSIPFPDKEKAEIAMTSLKVDPEPRRTKVTKILKVQDNILIASLEAPEAKNLRVAANSFLDHLTLVMKTIDMFG